MTAKEAILEETLINLDITHTKKIDITIVLLFNERKKNGHHAFPS